MEYLFNDRCVSLKGNVPWPKPLLNIRVQGLNEMAPVAGKASNCYITLSNSINYIKKILPKIGKDISGWAAVPNLAVLPEAGKQLNAYYNRNSLSFFYDVIDGETIYTSESNDIVAHELGHALLDSMRPDLWSTQSLEIWAFHESFADINAAISILQYDEVIDELISSTSGDLMVPNVVSQLAEQMGIAFYKQKGISVKSLRDMTQVFKYSDPSKLPKTGNKDEIFAECHSFGKIFSGAWYEMFSSIFQITSKDYGSPLDAAKAARDISAEMLYEAVYKAPKSMNFIFGVVDGIIAADEARGGRYKDILDSVFGKRHLNPIRMQGGISLPSTIKLSDYFTSSMGIENNDMYYANIDIPNANVLSMDELLKHVLGCVNSLDKDSWKIIEGNLVRQSIY